MNMTHVLNKWKRREVPAYFHEAGCATQAFINDTTFKNHFAYSRGNAFGGYNTHEGANTVRRRGSGGIMKRCRESLV